MPDNEMSVRSTDTPPSVTDPYLVRLDECRGHHGYRAIALVGMIVLFLGSLNLIEGLAAVGNPHFFATHPWPVVSDLTTSPRIDGGVIGHLNLRTWGWLAVAVGLTQISIGFGLPVKEQSCRWIAVTVFVVNATVQLLTFAAHPWWSLAILLLDVVAISVLVVYGKRQAPMPANSISHGMTCGPARRVEAIHSISIPRSGSASREHEASQWQGWRRSAQKVMRTWNEWLAADGHRSVELYSRHMAALAEEEEAAAELAAWTGGAGGHGGFA